MVALGNAVRSSAYLDALCGALGHANRAAGLRGDCSGCMLPLERKSVEPLAAHVDPLRVRARHQALHHFVAKSDWSDEAVLARVREQVSSRMDLEADVYWIVDDTGFRKKGRHSVGVARPYGGEIGKQDNGQVTVSVSLSTPLSGDRTLARIASKKPSRCVQPALPENHLPRGAPTTRSAPRDQLDSDVTLGNRRRDRSQAA
ncbi:transposase [Xanthomonas theicola]|uniref:transposase n=1 Tax=Xanthomonas theicola TaxID=56464 RepID=UPI003614641C